jgi:hypothetical protein
MIRNIAYRIHPASVVAMLALFVALGGVSYAAVDGKIGTPDIKNGAVTKVKIKKEAVTGPKIKSEAVTGAKVNESTLGIVPDAAKLAGKEPGAFESKGFGGGGDAKVVNVPKNSVKTVATQALPAGTYLVLARGGVNNNSGNELTAASIHCTLSAGSVSQKIEFGAFAKNAEPGDREEFDVFVLTTLPSGGEATLSCDANNEWSGNVTDPSIVAVSLQS